MSLRWTALVPILIVPLGCAAPPAGPSAEKEHASRSLPGGNPPASLRQASPEERPREAPRSYEHLTLEGAWALAGEIHPDLAVARARVEASGGRVDQAGLLPNPEIVGRMESAPFRGRTAGDAEYVAGVSQIVPIGGRLGAASDLERRERERRERELEWTRIEVRRRVHSAYALALFADAVAVLEDRSLEIAARGAAAARRLLDVGEGVPADVARADLEESRARLESRRAASIREQSLERLAAAMGAPDARIGALSGEIGAAFEIPALQSVIEKLEGSALLEAADARVDVESARLELSEAERIPDVTFDLFYRRLQETETDAFDVGLAIAVPVFDRRQGSRAEALAARTAAEAEARSVRIEARGRVRDAHARLVAASERARLLEEEILPRMVEVRAAIERRYEAGDLSLPEILPVRREEVSLELERLEALRDAMEAWIELRPFLLG